MSYAYRCQICSLESVWTIRRHGDAVISWACEEHPNRVCLALQRNPDLYGITRLTVTASGSVE